MGRVLQSRMGKEMVTCDVNDGCGGGMMVTVGVRRGGTGANGGDWQQLCKLSTKEECSRCFKGASCRWENELE